VIIGDANLAETSTFLKVGTTALVLDMIEAGQRFDDLRLAEPVRSVHAISRDPSLQAKVELADGRKMTGLDLQWAYRDRAAEHVTRTQGEEVDPVTSEVMTIWGEVLDALGRDPMECADRLDWPAKLRLLEATGPATRWPGPRPGCSWSTCSTRTCGWQGPVQRLVARGRCGGW